MSESPNPTIVSTAVHHVLADSDVYLNAKQKVIIITEDRANLRLREWEETIASGNAWVAPLCLFLSLLLNYVTAGTYKDFLGISKDQWAALFLISLLLSLAWLIRELARRKKSMTVIDVLERMKKEAAVPQTPIENPTAGGNG